MDKDQPGVSVVTLLVMLVVIDGVHAQGVSN